MILGTFRFEIKYKAVVAQLVEHVLGKDEVTGPNPVNGSRLEGALDSVEVNHLI